MQHYNKLSDEQRYHIFEEMYDMLDDKEQDCVDELIYVTIHGEHLNDEMAKRWVSNMVHRDGTKGEHFSWETVSTIKRDYDIKDVSVAELYAVMNMLWSDYSDILRNDTDTYVRMTKDWLFDKDAREGKTYRYFKHIVK